MARKTKIFTIYAWEDKNAMLQLLRHLKPFAENFDLTFWNDEPINAGHEWKPQDESRLGKADIFLLLVSSDFMNSEFIKQLEFKNIIDRYKADEAVVIPIILEYCQWEIDFQSDEYDFNLNELEVLPDDGKPLENWITPDQAFKNIAGNVKKAINSLTEGSKHKGFEIEENKEKNTIGKDQMAMNFSEESATKKKSGTEYLTKEELQSKRDAEEELRLETIKKAEEELRLKKQAEEKLRAEEEERLLKEDEARRRVEQEHGEKAREKAEKEIRAEEEERLIEEAEAQKRIEEENRINAAVEAEARRIEEQHRLEEEEEYQEQYSSESNEDTQETQSEENQSTRKRILVGGLIALLAIVGIWAFSKFDTGTDEPESYLPDTDEVEVKGPPASSDETEIDFTKEEDFSKMLVGETHDGGIIFTIDYINKTGKIAHIDDAGPMPWKEAMKIEEKLGKGWRLPTMDELRLMHKTIGQGATNEGEFADELYWSSTPYDKNQARLVRFRDGNTSYHYNSGGTHRKFLVRAIHDFSR